MLFTSTGRTGRSARAVLISVSATIAQRTPGSAFPFKQQNGTSTFRAPSALPCFLPFVSVSLRGNRSPKLEPFLSFSSEDESSEDESVSLLSQGARGLPLF